MANVIPHDFEYLEDLLLNEVRTLQRFKRELQIKFTYTITYIGQSHSTPNLFLGKLTLFY